MKYSFMLLSSAIILITSACNNNHHKKEESISYHVSLPLAIDTEIVTQYVGQIQSIRHIELRSQEKGYLQNIYVDEGQYVRKGQLLFQIQPTLYSGELEKVQAELEALQIEYNNTKLLADKDVVSNNELLLAKAKYNKALADVKLAKTHLNFTKIYAPFDGYVDRLELKLGSLVEEGEKLTSISDNSKMWVYFNVPELEYLNFKLNNDNGQMNSVQLLLANNQLFNQIGNVETIEADFNNETGNIAFRATFNNPELILRNGQTGNILMKSPVKNGLIIPQKSTVGILDKKYVFVVDNNNVIHQKLISVSNELTDMFIVSEGLQTTDKILIEGLGKVKDGDTIHFEMINPREIISNLQLDAE